MVVGNILISFSFSLLKNLPSVPHSGCSQHLVSVMEGPLFSIPSPTFIVPSVFDYGHSDRREVFEVLICISFILMMLTSFHEIFKTLWVKLTYSNGLFEHLLCFEYFSDDLSRTFLERSVFFLKPFRHCEYKYHFSSIQLLSRVLTLCDPIDCSTPGFPVHQQLLELSQNHVHLVGDAIHPSHPLLSPSPLAFNPSQHQGLFKWVSFSYQVAKVLEFQLQYQSFQWIFTVDFL